MIGVVVILAIVQGLTEFLPVSSSGHLVLLNKFFGIESDFLLLSVILHVATLFSVVWVLRKEVLQVARRKRRTSLIKSRRWAINTPRSVRLRRRSSICTFPNKRRITFLLQKKKLSLSKNYIRKAL